MSNMASWPPNCPKNQVRPSMTIPSSESRHSDSTPSPHMCPLDRSLSDSTTPLSSITNKPNSKRLLLSSGRLTTLKSMSVVRDMGQSNKENIPFGQHSIPTPNLNLSNSPPEIVTILLQQQQLLNEMQSQLSTLVASSQLRSQDLAITSTSSISSTQASQSHKLITSSAGQKRLTMCIASDHNYAKKSCEEPAAVHFDSEELAGLNAMQVESGHGGEEDKKHPGVSGVKAKINSEKLLGMQAVQMESGCGGAKATTGLGCVVAEEGTKERSGIPEGEERGLERNRVEEDMGEKLVSGCTDALLGQSMKQEKERFRKEQFVEEVWDGVSTELKVGLKLSRNQIKRFMALYGERNDTKMVVTQGGATDQSKSQKVRLPILNKLAVYSIFQIVFSCSHGQERTSVAKEENRPFVHTTKLGCSVFVRFSCRGNQDCRNVCVIKAYEETHNHETSQAMFLQETNKIEGEEEISIVDKAGKLNVRATKLKSHMQLEFKKPGLSTRHIRYIMQKVKVKETDNEDLEVFLAAIEDEGGSVEVLMDQDNKKVKVLTIKTKQMMQAYNGVNPTVVNYDTTFGFSSEGYKMSAFAYLNPVTNRGEVGQINFLADEGGDSLDFAFQSFKSSILSDPLYMLIDKDFKEIATIKKVFPSCIYIFCQFHVLKWQKSLISTARSTDVSVKVDLEKKDKIMETLRSYMYSHSKDDAKDWSEKFHNEIYGVEVRVGNGDSGYYTNFESYFTKNWETCRDKWLTCERRSIPGLEEENTNNRLERMWRSMKDHLKQMTPASSICKAVMVLVSFAENQLVDSYTWHLRHRVRIANKDPEVVGEYARAAIQLNERGMVKFKLSMDLFIKRKNQMKVVEQKTDEYVLIEETFEKKMSSSKAHPLGAKASIDSQELAGLKAMQRESGHGGEKDKKQPGVGSSEDEKTYGEFRDEIVTEEQSELEDPGGQGDIEEDVTQNRDKVKTNEQGDEENVGVRKQVTVQYLSDGKICNCSFNTRTGAPCRHILFVRQLKKVPLFHPSLFNPRFCKDRLSDLNQNEVVEVEKIANNKQFQELVDDPEDKKPRVLNRGEKYRKLGPLTERFLEATLRNGTKRVGQYIGELEILINKAKNGQSLLMKETRGQDQEEGPHVRDEFYEEINILTKTEEKNKNEKVDLESPDKKKRKFDLNWLAKSAGGKAGRPKDSKVKFMRKPTGTKASRGKKRKNVDLPESTNECSKAEIQPLCSFPYNKSNPRKDGLFPDDIKSLQPRSFVTDSIVNFKLRQLQPSGPSGSSVWLLDNNHAQQITSWWNSPTLTRQVEDAKLFQEDGCQFVFMSWCQWHHFFGIVGDCRGDLPAIYVLESIGGYGEPVGVEKLAEFMKETRQTRGLPPAPIPVHTPDVPRQAQGSNDCGLYMLESATKVLISPDEFIQKARTNQLSDWYPVASVAGRRNELLTEIEKLIEEQSKLKEAESGDLEVDVFDALFNLPKKARKM